MLETLLVGANGTVSSEPDFGAFLQCRRGGAASSYRQRRRQPTGSPPAPQEGRGGGRRGGYFAPNASAAIASTTLFMFMVETLVAGTMTNFLVANCLASCIFT